MQVFLLFIGTFVAQVAASSDSSSSPYLQFCEHHGFEGCFAITNVYVSDSHLTIDFRPPLPVSHVFSEEVQMEKSQGWETFFDTEFGEGTLLQLPGPAAAFVGEVPLDHHTVLHILPCEAHDDACTSFGYVLQEAGEEDGDDVDGSWDYALYEEDVSSWDYEETDSTWDEDHEDPEWDVAAAANQLPSAKLTGSLSLDPHHLRRMLTNDVSQDCVWQRVTTTTDFQNLATQAQILSSCGSGVGCAAQFGIQKWDVCALEDGVITGEGHGSQVRGLQGSGSHRSCWIVEKCSFSATFIVPQSNWPAFYRSQASLLVAEFNQALQASGLPHRMWLKEVAFKQWDTSQYGKTACLSAAQNYQSDMVHCITPNSMGKKTSGSWVYGSAYFPGSSANKRGVSFARVDTLPNSKYSSRHTSVHEMGHNLGALHTKQKDNEKSTMYKGTGSSNRLLKFFNTAQSSESSKVRKNIQNINKYADDIASHHMDG